MNHKKAYQTSYINYEVYTWRIVYKNKYDNIGCFLNIDLEAYLNNLYIKN